MQHVRLFFVSFKVHLMGMPFSHIGTRFLRDANNYSDDIVVATAGNKTEDESINIDAAYAYRRMFQKLDLYESCLKYIDKFDGLSSQHLASMACRHATFE